MLVLLFAESVLDSAIKGAIIGGAIGLVAGGVIALQKLFRKKKDEDKSERD